MSLNLKELLLQEQSKKQCDEIVSYIGDDPKRFAELMALFFTGEYRITQRAAWPLGYCVRAHPRLIVPFLGQLIRKLDKEGQHPAVARNTLRLLQDIDIPKRFHGQLMSKCFTFIQSPTLPAAIKAFSLTILHTLSKQYPDILPELKLIIEERAGTETAAFRSRAKRIK